LCPTRIRVIDMKKILLLLALGIISCKLSAQLTGQFGFGEDGHVYFYLSNPTYYQITVTWGAFNFEKNQSVSNQGVMNSGAIFVFGPNAGWTWEKGERFSITYSNGQTDYWNCPYTDPSVRENPAFRGRGKTGSCNTPSHNCTGYVDSNGDNLCDVCYRKGYKCHIVYHN